MVYYINSLGLRVGDDTILKKLIVFAIISVNLGYTVFLFPLLSMIYEGKVPFTL